VSAWLQVSPKTGPHIRPKPAGHDENTHTVFIGRLVGSENAVRRRRKICVDEDGDGIVMPPFPSATPTCTQWP
jgi:hypothetical protein